MNAKEYYQAGQLAEAISAASEEVRQHPQEVSPRGLLCELLCFAGELQRADLQLDALAHQDPQSQLGIVMFRQLVRAALARQQFYGEGRLPEFLDPPSPRLRRHLEASICLREGHSDQAAALLAEAERQRPELTGTCNRQPFTGLRDLDDLTSSFFEVLTSNGKYYWIPMERVEQIEFCRPQRPRDLLWRPAHISVSDGPTGDVFLPALYAGSHGDADERVRLGRLTDWRGGDGGPSRGVGQRIFLVGEQDRSILELEEITITAPASGTEHAPSPQ
jgi:type VI secretion system protein ImpE